MGSGFNSYSFRSTASKATLQVWTLAVASLQQNTFGDLTSAFFMDGGSQLSSKFA